MCNQSHCQEDDNRNRDRSYSTGTDNKELIGQVADRTSVRIQERRTSGRRHHTQGDDEGRDSCRCKDGSVDETTEATSQKTDKHRDKTL